MDKKNVITNKNTNAVKKNQNNNIYAHSPQYYKKVNGEYIPANDSYALDGLEEGCWMVIVKPGSKSIRSLIRPEFKNLIAALRYLEDGLVSEMSKKSQMRPYATPMSPKEIKAWEVYKKIMGKDMPTYFCYSSLQEIADEGIKFIQKIMIENNMDINKIKKEFQKEHKRKIINGILDLEVSDV